MKKKTITHRKVKLQLVTNGDVYLCYCGDYHIRISRAMYLEATGGNKDMLDVFVTSFKEAGVC